MSNRETLPVRVRVVIEYDADLYLDPDCYEGATTVKAILAKEQQFIEGDGDYLISELQFRASTTTATVTPREQCEQPGGCR